MDFAILGIVAPLCIVLFGVIIPATYSFVLDRWIGMNTEEHPNQHFKHMSRPFLEKNFTCHFNYTSTVDGMAYRVYNMDELLMMDVVGLVDRNQPIECWAMRKHWLPRASRYIRANYMREHGWWYITYCDDYALGGHYPKSIDKLVWDRDPSEPLQDPFHNPKRTR